MPRWKSAGTLIFAAAPSSSGPIRRRARAEASSPRPATRPGSTASGRRCRSRARGAWRRRRGAAGSRKPCSSAATVRSIARCRTGSWPSPPRGADAFEEASIDEAYLDLSSLGDFERAAVHARAVKAEVVEREGLTCSIGIGPNKLVAKIASDFQKPDGLTVVQPEAVQAFLDPLPIRRIPGIGPKSEASLHERGDPDDRRAARRRADAARGMVRQGGHGDGTSGRAASPTAPFPTSGSASRSGEQETFERDTLEPTLILGARARRSPRACSSVCGPTASAASGPSPSPSLRELRDPDPLPDGGDPDRRARTRSRRSRTICCCRSSTSARTPSGGRSA